MSRLAWMTGIALAVAGLGCGGTPMPERPPSSGPGAVRPASSRTERPSPTAPASTDPTASTCPAGRRSVQVVDGNVALCRSDGRRVWLSSSGHDLEPVLSPSGARVAFVRDFGKVELPRGEGERVTVDDRRVFVVEVAGGTAREVARSGPCQTPGRPRFVGEGHLLVRGWGLAPTVHNLSVCVVDLRTGAMKELARRTHCAMPIRGGRFAGAIFVGGVEWVDGGGTLPWWRIFDTDGKVVRELDGDPFEPATGPSARDDAPLGCDEPPEDARALVTEIEATL